LSAPNCRGVFVDNYFDLIPGRHSTRVRT
jgi:hypothetical protein